MAAKGVIPVPHQVRNKLQLESRVFIGLRAPAGVYPAPDAGRERQ